MVVDTGFLMGLYGYIKTAAGLYKLTKEEADRLRQPIITQKFLENKDVNPVIINSKGGNVMYIANYDNIPKDIKEKITEQFIKESLEEKKDIKIIDAQFHERIQKNRNISAEDKKLAHFFNYMSLEIRNILELAIKVKYFYEHEPKEAFKIKSDIGAQYGKFGRKLCNLYTQGYITELFDYLLISCDQNYELIEQKINHEILKLVANSNHIFFINKYVDENEIINKIKNAIKQNVKYIAVHSAGNNTNKALLISDNVAKDARKADYTIKEEPLKNKQNIPVFSFYLTLKNNDKSKNISFLLK